MLFQKRRLFLIIFICYLAFNSYSQTRPNSFGNIFIPENGFISVFGHHSFIEGGAFLEPGIIETARSQNPGCIVYATNSSWSGASSKQYVEGYAKSYHLSAFTFPIGNEGQYRPAVLSKSFESIAGYYYKNPNSLSKSLQESIAEISTKEYWDVKFPSATKLTLTWDEASQLDEQNMEQLSILALSKDGIWEIIPSIIDESALNPSVHNALYYTTIKSKPTFGSITSSIEILPDLYQYYTLGYVKAEQKDFNFIATVFPNPQFTGSTVSVDLESSEKLSGLDVAIHTADNSIIYTTHIDEAANSIDIPYRFKESGPYIITIKTERTILHKNIVIVDP